jgi:uncharacterized membrane protein YGL010W
MTRDRKWFSNLTPVLSKEYITIGDNVGRVLSVGSVKVSENVTLKCVALSSLSGSIFFRFPSFFMRVLRSVQRRVLLVCWILEAISYMRSFPRVKFSKSIFLVFWLFSLVCCGCFGRALEMA